MTEEARGEERPEIAVNESGVPYFAWDRQITVAEIRRVLRFGTATERTRTIGWIMREAKFRDVWSFISPQEAADEYARIEPYLGRKKQFWQFVLRKWRELGKIEGANPREPRVTG